MAIYAIRRAVCVAAGMAVVSGGGRALAGEADLIEGIRPYVAGVVGEFGQIPEPRKKELTKAALFVRSQIAAGQEAKLTFICTHNSRRSHLSQIWAQAAALYYDVAGVKTFSGGTEATACNIRTVGALRRSGLEITDSTGGKNPVYLVQYGKTAPPIRAFSKVYSGEGNPTEGFAAMMTCTQADGNCPVVEGSAIRIRIHYEDPKVADDTPGEASRYDERCRQIAREMFFMMSRVRE